MEMDDAVVAMEEEGFRGQSCWIRKDETVDARSREKAQLSICVFNEVLRRELVQLTTKTRGKITLRQSGYELSVQLRTLFFLSVRSEMSFVTGSTYSEKGSNSVGRRHKADVEKEWPT